MTDVLTEITRLRDCQRKAAALRALAELDAITSQVFPDDGERAKEQFALALELARRLRGEIEHGCLS